MEKESRERRITLACGLGFLAFGICFTLSTFIEKLLVSTIITSVGIILMGVGSILILISNMAIKKI